MSIEKIKNNYNDELPAIVVKYETGDTRQIIEFKTPEDFKAFKEAGGIKVDVSSAE